MSSTPFETVTSKPKSAAKARKRAPKACLNCRARKVRCDVSQRGRPCMNCYLDSETCVVTGRASRFRRSPLDENENIEASYPPYSKDDCSYGRSSEDIVNSRINGQPVSPRPNDGDCSPEGISNSANYSGQSVGINIDSGERIEPSQQHGSGNRISSPMQSFQETAPIPLQDFDSFMSSGMQPLWAGDQHIANETDITYSYYPFITLSNLQNIMPQDVNYLESQGCLRVPTRSIFDEFVREYFLHVHPMMPVINEGDFWDMYCHHVPGEPAEKISLIVFQAILFSSCNFVSKSSIKALGFPSIRAARATFYRRTKLLFDFEAETSPISIAQTALLLTYWTPNWSHATKKTNTAWLGVAIQNAKSADAHLYSAIPTLCGAADTAKRKHNMLKRLWWCCIIRDRILALGMRRSLQISRARFDFNANTGLEYADLSDEVEKSKVYNAEAKRRLVEIFIQVGELCSVLTDLLTLVFPLDDLPGWGKQLGSEGATRVRECKAELKRWYKGAMLRFPLFDGGSTPIMASTKGKQSRHDSVILYTNLMYMYYHSARVVLCHHEVLQMAVASTSPNLNNNIKAFANLYENRHEIQDAACGVTECLKELIQLRLARFLPVSAVACTALPLVLHIIDVKLSSQNRGKGNSAGSDMQLALKQHRLNILIQAMKTYQPQYDGVDYISETIRHIINLAQLDPPTDTNNINSSPFSSPINQASISSWSDILASQPGYYLRLAMTMDLSLSKGRLADESDFPASLRVLFSADFSPIRTMIASGKPDPAPAEPSQTQPYFTSSPGINIPLGTVHSLSSDEESSSSSPDSQDGNVPRTSDIPFDEGQAEMPSGDIQMGGVFFNGFSIDGLASEVLAACALDIDENQGIPPGSSGLDESMYGGHDQQAGLGEDDWIKKAWSDEGMEEAGARTQAPDESAADRETARALLEGIGCPA
ncbi:fungal-specific transcription factor domain-containing protein [Xylariaceae sp. FL0662B]|nr:fungal-specific transcription factor domain-containing protein [Xylariaceae sp. FL0662B]